MSPEEIIISILSGLGLVGAGVWAAAEGTKPIVPAGPQTTIQGQAVTTITTVQTGPVQPREAHQAALEAAVAWSRAMHTIPPGKTIRIHLLSTAEFASWRDRYGASPTAKAFQAGTWQRFGSGAPAVFVSAEGRTKIEVLSLIVHEVIHVHAGDRTHADARLWWGAGGLESAESQAIAKLWARYVPKNAKRKRAR